MTFLLIAWGSGDGCDYTIGCNQRVTELKAKTLEEAQLEVKKIIMGDQPEYFGDYKNEPHYLSKAQIVEVAETVNVEGIYDECRALAAAQKEKDAMPAEKAEYARLKKKFS